MDHKILVVNAVTPTSTPDPSAHTAMESINNVSIFPEWRYWRCHATTLTIELSAAVINKIRPCGVIR